MKRKWWASLLLVACVGLSGQRADAMRTPLADVRASITQPHQITATTAELQADEWLVESITPLGLTDDGQPLALISLLVPLSSLDELPPTSTRAGPYAAPKTHTRVFCIVQPPLGLATAVTPPPGKGVKYVAPPTQAKSFREMGYILKADGALKDLQAYLNHVGGFPAESWHPEARRLLKEWDVTQITTSANSSYHRNKHRAQHWEPKVREFLLRARGLEPEAQAMLSRMPSSKMRPSGTQTEFESILQQLQQSRAAKSAGQLGREGEAISAQITGVGKNTESWAVNGRMRIPDHVQAQDIVTRTPTMVTETKNVQYQAYTRQFRDYADLVGPGGRVDAALPPGARVSGPLLRAFNDPLNPLNRIDLVPPR